MFGGMGCTCINSRPLFRSSHGWEALLSGRCFTRERMSRQSSSYTHPVFALWESGRASPVIPTSPSTQLLPGAPRCCITPNPDAGWLWAGGDRRFSRTSGRPPVSTHVGNNCSQSG